MEDNYSKLYRAMVNSGYDAADLGGNEEEFRSAMQDSTMRKNFYDWASKNEKNGFRIGSYESYEARLAPAAKPSPAPLTPAAEEPRKEKAYTQVPALKAALEYDPMKNIEDKVKEAKEKKQSAADTEEAWRGVAAKMSLDAGRVPFRTVDSAAVSERLEQSGDAAREVVFGFREQPFSYKTTAEKIAKERMQNVKIQDDARDYVAETMGIKKDDITDIGEYTQEGGAYYADFSRAEEKRMNKELNDALTKQGDALYQQVGASLQEKMNKINPYKEITKNFLLGIGTTQWGAPQAPDSYMIGIDDEQTAVTYAAARALSLAKGMQEAAHDDGMWGNFLEGALSGLAEAGENMTDAKKMNDAIATVVKKWEEGGETTKLLNDDEKMLLDALAYQTAVASMYQDKISSSYNVGRTVGAMLPFAVEFLVNPASGLGRKTASQFGKYALKRFAKNTANKYVRSAIYNTGRGLGRIGGSVAGGAAMTATTGLPKTVLGVQERMLGRPDVDYADGKPVYTGQIDSEEFLPAVKKEVAKQMLEYGSEMLGAGYLDDMFTAARKLTKGTKGLGWIDRIVSGPRAKAVKSFMERTGWNGPLEEFLEEVHVGYLEPYLVGDTTHDKFFTPDNLIEVALGVAVPGTVMSTAKTIAGAADGSFKAGAAERWKMDRADRAAVAQWGAKWESWRDLRNTLMVSQPEEIEAKLKEIAGDNSLTGEQKMAAIDFGIYSLQYRTARGVADAMTPARKKNIDSMLHDIIFDARSRGYEAVESEKDAGNEGAAPDVVDGNTIALAEQALKDAETEVRRVLALSPDADVEAAINGRTAEEVALGDEIVAETINAYTTAKAKLEGMQDTLNKARESDRQIDETANDGVVYATTLSKTGEKIFITSGKVVLNNEGFIDVNQSEKLVALMPDSSKKFVKPGELREKIEVSNAEELKAAKRAEIVESGKVKGEIGNLEGEPTVAAGESVSQSGELVPGAEVEVAFDGNVFKLKVEGRDERGDIILSGEGASMAMPESLVLDGMKEAEALRNGKVVEPADEAAAPVVEAPKTALEQIPRNEKNVPLYEQVDSELAWDGVVEEAGGNEETAMIAVNSMIADKQDALKKAEKAKAKAGVTITEKIAAENERVANIERAKADLAKWEEIAGVKAKRALAAEAESKRVADEAAAKQRAEEERLRAEREAAERAEREALNGVPDMVDDKPQDARARGYRRVNGHKVDRQEPVRGLMGKEVAVKFSDSSIPTGRVAVIEAEQLQPSHIQGQRNPLHFIDEAQPKERNDAASVLSARKIAENVRPEEITSSVTAYTGAPTVNARGEAVQGNNRSAALRLMWENNPEQAAKYKQYLMDHAAEFGLNAEEIAAMKSPVLVNMLDVSDADAITLGQYVAQDTESGEVADAQAFADASATNTLEAYQDYLDNHPEGAYREGARAGMWMIEGINPETHGRNVVARNAANAVLARVEAPQATNKMQEAELAPAAEPVGNSEQEKPTQKFGYHVGQKVYLPRRGSIRQAEILEFGDSYIRVRYDNIDGKTITMNFAAEYFDKLKKQAEAMMETDNNQVTEGGNAPGQSGVSASLVKGAKWENTGEPDKIKSSRKKGDSHDITWYIGKKKYGSTTAERDLLVILAEDYGGDLNAVWNAYEQGEVLLSANEAAILKKLIETNTSAAELQQGVLELDRENPAFERATENVRKKLEATGVKVVQATKKMVDALMKGSAEGLTADELHELRGIVARGLADAEVKIVNCGKNPFNTKQKTVALKKEVLNYAEKNGIIGTMSNEETNGKGEVRISKKSIGKFVDDSASDKSVDKDVHLSVLPQIRDVIASSIEAEVHPDYIKIGDDRSRENGYNKNVLIHRCYGAVNVDGKVYRVKITLKEDIANRDTKAYSYEVTNIELLEGTDENAVTVLSQQDSSITGAKLLDKVEKSYDKGTKLLSASKNVPDFMKTFHGSGAKFDKFDHSFMGTGEGAQSFGWGTYVTEVEGIGKQYANSSNQLQKLRGMEFERDRIKKDIEFWENRVGYFKSQDNDNARSIVAQGEAILRSLNTELATVNKQIKESGIGRNLYTVEIPDDNGSNYLHWEKPINGEIQERIANGLQSIGFEIEPDMNHLAFSREGKFAVLNINAKGMDLYAELSEALGGDKAASQFLNDMGFVGVSYPAEAMTGGRTDGARNYVIFNENDAQIESRIEFLRTPDGVTYGWAVNGTIYLTPEGLNPNTPIHEYTHLWAAALQKSNPKLWSEVVEAMKLSPAWNEVMADDNYTDIHGDENRVASEVLSRLSGNEGYRRYMEQAEAEIAAERNIGEKVRKKGILNRIKNAVSRFWNWLKGKLGSKAKAANEQAEEAKAEPWDVFVNKSLKDFDEGVNPDAKDSPLEKMAAGENSAEMQEGETLFSKKVLTPEQKKKQEALKENAKAIRKLHNVTSKYPITALRNLGFALETQEQREMHDRLFAERDAITGESMPAGLQTNPQAMTLQERITESLLKLADKEKENVEMRLSAIRAYGRDLANVIKLMNAQKGYDKRTVRMFTDLVKMYLRNNAMDGMSSYDVMRLLNLMQKATGGNANMVNQAAVKIAEIITNEHTRQLKEIMEKQMKTGAERVNASGVVVQGGVDIIGKRILNTYKDAIELKDDKDFEQKYNDAFKKVGEIQKLIDQNGSNKTLENQLKEAQAEADAMLLAATYRNEIKSAEADIEALKDELTKKRTAAERGEITWGEYHEFAKTINSQIVQLRAQQIDAYQKVLHALSGDIYEGVQRARAFREAEAMRVQRIHDMAENDMGGVSKSAERKEPGVAGKTVDMVVYKNPGVRLVMNGLGTYENYMKYFGRDHLDGRGELFNHFITAFTEAQNKEWKESQNDFNILEAAARDIFDKKKKKTYMSIARDSTKGSGVILKYWNGGAVVERELTIGQLMYLYMTEKQAEGQMKLRNMGLTEEKVQNAVAKLPAKYKAFADYIQTSFLPEMRPRMNEVHQRMFGASMSEVENYFPLKVNQDARKGDTDLNNTGDAIPSTITGAVIKRRVNVTPIDLTANAFDVLNEHIVDMEHWAAFAEFIRDNNTLINDKDFKNRVQNTKSVRYGDGETLWKNFVDTARIATGNYKSKADYLAKLMRGANAAKITFGYYTALKQLASAPAFWSDAKIWDAVWYSVNPMGSWRWAIKNLPGFEERWKGRTGGNERLGENEYSIHDSRIMKAARMVGMTPNAFVDAVVVASGARAVYKDRLNFYKKLGMTEYEADRRAKNDAAISYNETQQSGQGAYLSTLQREGGLGALLTTLFRNSQMAFQRRVVGSIVEIGKKLARGEKIREATKQKYINMGMSEEAAGKQANRDFYKAYAKDFTNLAIFGYGMNFVWALMGELPYLLFGDDEEEKEKIWETASKMGATGMFEGFSLGNFAKGIYEKHITDGKYAVGLLEAPFEGDLQVVLERFEKDGTLAGITQLATFMVEMNTGISPQRLIDDVAAWVYRSNGDVDTATKALLLALRWMKVPQSQQDKLILDETDGADAEEVKSIAEWYIKYKMARNFPLGSEDEKRVDKYANKFVETLKERVEKEYSPEDISVIFDQSSDTEKEILKKKWVEEMDKRNGTNAAKSLRKEKIEELLGSPVEKAAQKALHKYSMTNPYEEMETFEDLQEFYEIKAMLNKLQPLEDEWKKIEEKEGYESAYKFYQENQKAFDLYDELAEIEKGVSNIKKLMKDEPEDPVKDMADIRELRTKAIDLINNYNE